MNACALRVNAYWRAFVQNSAKFIPVSKVSCDKCSEICTKIYMSSNEVVTFSEKESEYDDEGQNSSGTQGSDASIEGPEFLDSLIRSAKQQQEDLRELGEIGLA